MRLVYKFRHAKKNENTRQLNILTHISKNLYNEANYIIRQEFFSTKRWVRYYELYMQLKAGQKLDRKYLSYEKPKE